VIRANRLPDGMTPRLLSRDAAAAYLGISAEHFTAHIVASVAPVEIGRRILWDVRALDRWLDERSGTVHAPDFKGRLLGALDGDSNEGRQARSQ